RKRRCPHGYCAEQDIEGFRGEIADNAGQTRTVRPWLGLSWPSYRIQSSKGIAHPFSAGGPKKIRGVCPKINRHPPRAIQATRRLRRLGKSVSNDGPQIRSGNPARVRGFCRERSGLPGTEAGVLEHGRANRAC